MGGNKGFPANKGKFDIIGENTNKSENLKAFV